MKRQQFQADGGAKGGVALIVVLGYLSIMILMALAFLTQARTERLVADATLEANRGRQLVRTALAAAMNDYSATLFGERVLLPPVALEVFESVAPTPAVDMGRTLAQDNIRLMQGEARGWLPRRYLTMATSNIVGNAEWILVREDPSSPNSRILGRYAYVCFDMSGGVDANLIALTSGVANEGLADSTNALRPIARSSVRDVGMGELKETANASEFKRLREGWHGFDNLAELILLTNGKYNGGEQQYEDEDLDTTAWGAPAAARWRGKRVEQYGAALTSSEVTDLVPYSLAAYRGIYNIATASWSAPQLCDASANWSTILTPVAGQLVDLQATVKAIQDYVNPSPTPQGVDYPSSKNVPMLNELEVRYNLRYVAPEDPIPGGLYLDVELAFETWYPFPSEDNPLSGGFTIPPPDMQGGSGAVAGNPNVWIQLVRILGIPGGANLVRPVGLPPAINTQAEFYNGKPKQAPGTMLFAFEVVPINPLEIPGPGTRIQLLMDIANRAGQNAGIEVRSGAAVVDRMKAQGEMIVLTPNAGWQTRHLEVRDPRLNHEPGEWVVGSGTMDALNTETLNSAEYGKEGQYMYCRNGLMKTPAELGFIPSGRSWETIDLCTPAGAEMLSQLVVDPTITTAISSSGTYYTNGTINPNTSSTNVLLAAFTGLAKREVPNAPPTMDRNPVTRDEALDLAGAMIDASKTKKILATGGAFMSGPAWASSPAMVEGGLLAGRGVNENQRESLIRNTWGLFSPNNSLFTVLMIGQGIKEGPGQAGSWNANEDIITGERRAVALVWRDPLPSTGGYHHEMFVRMFKFLDE